MRRIRNIFLALAILGPLVAGRLCRGQSTFHFSNLWPPGLDAPIFDAEGNPLTGANYVAILYGGTTIDSLSLATFELSFQPMQPEPFKDQAPGYFNLGGWVAIPTVPGGSTAWLQVRAWEARLGATYEDVVALGIGGYGESGFFQARGGDPYATGVPIPPEPLFGLQSFSLREIVPEPTTALILLLGLPVLLWRRRCPK